MKELSFVFALATAAGLFGCGKSVQTGAPANFKLPSDPAFTEVPLPPILQQCPTDRTVQWQFVQPDAVQKKIVDLLFVVDTSSSMAPKRTRIADTIPAFIAQLTPDTDYRIAVMLAHGGASFDTGRLFSAAGTPSVLSSSSLSPSAIQADLKKTLLNVDSDYDEANGEAPLYSLMRSLKSDRLAEIQAEGFYRPAAALSTVIVSDENDICFPSERNGYSTFPDFVPSLGGIEAVAFEKYCRSPGQTASNFPDLVYSKLQSLKGSLPITLGGITHVDPTKVPQGHGIEDSIGHGIIEFVHKSSEGLLIDIGDTSYAAGLTRLGNVVQTSLTLQTRFPLDGSAAILPDAVWVHVDGKAVLSKFDSASRFVQLAIADAGKSKSVVQVDACLSPTL